MWEFLQNGKCHPDAVIWFQVCLFLLLLCVVVRGVRELGIPADFGPTSDISRYVRLRWARYASWIGVAGLLVGVVWTFIQLWYPTFTLYRETAPHTMLYASQSYSFSLELGFLLFASGKVVSIVCEHLVARTFHDKAGST